DTPQQFDAWVASQKKTAAQDPAAAEGRAVFEGNACANCHTISGTSAHGVFGPDLSHLATRDTIASGSVPNTPQNLRAFIGDPAHMKPGALMPAMHLNQHDLDAVTKYLTTLR
ncbi:MAG TPA: cytochrome c, partial [Terracidiphilus sp.]|nr:cytochrome c [Terracidiphilus sp.]